MLSGCEVSCSGLPPLVSSNNSQNHKSRTRSDAHQIIVSVVNVLTRIVVQSRSNSTSKRAKHNGFIGGRGVLMRVLACL